MMPWLISLRSLSFMASKILIMNLQKTYHDFPADIPAEHVFAVLIKQHYQLIPTPVPAA